ncbi:MAG: selenium cofactor biosynthesis protein YqeC [bacterium]|nr:selenium cofactor biosynthesis protein YqeC [bacterium]
MKLNLLSTLGLTKPAVVSIIGTGGKTTLMYRLAKELVTRKHTVITTTTTKIYPPEPEQSPCLIEVSKITADKIRFINGLINKERHITLTAGRNQEDKLVGFKPSVIDKLVNQLQPDYLLIEADGARGKSLKAYRLENPQSVIQNSKPKSAILNLKSHIEPVIPRSTTLCILVIGWDVLGKPLNERYVHRAKLLANLIHAQLNSNISIAHIIDALCLPGGYISRVPTKCTLTVFINKVEVERNSKNLVDFCAELNNQSPRRINQIVIGSLLDEHHKFIVVQSKTNR